MSVTGLLHTPFTWPLFVFVILTLQKPELGNSNSLSILLIYPMSVSQCLSLTEKNTSMMTAV